MIDVLYPLLTCMHLNNKALCIDMTTTNIRSSHLGKALHAHLLQPDLPQIQQPERFCRQQPERFCRQASGDPTLMELLANLTKDVMYAKGLEREHQRMQCLNIHFCLWDLFRTEV